MANVKITQLPSATTPLTGTEVFPLVQGTTTKQVAITGLFTSPVMSNPTLGVVGQADLINATGLPIASGVSGLGAGIATFLGTPSSANLRAAVTDETGSGALVFANAPVLVAPDLGTPTFLVATNATGTAVGLTAGSAITNANLTGAVTSVGNATSLGSFTSAQLRTALTDETGAGSAVFATSPTITAPILNQINDTNNAQILGLSPTTSAVDYLVVKNGIGVAVPLHFYADGSSANIGLHIQPKGTGLVTISDGTDFNKGIRFRSSGSAASAVTLLDAVSTAGRVVTLPDATTTLVGRDTTDTLTNKTIAFSSNTFTGALSIANGGTGQTTANAAFNALAPSQTGNSGKYLTTDGTDTSWASNPLGTVTSVAASVPSFLSIAGSPITTSGTLAFTLSGTALPTTSGGTGLTSFTSGGVVYASSTSALATGSGFTYNGTSAQIGDSLSAADGSRLYIYGDASGSTQIGIKIGGNTNALPQQAIRFYDTWFDTYAGYIGFTTNALTFGSGTTEGLRLTSTSLYTASGINVGIGLSNPAYKLSVSAADTGNVVGGSTAAVTISNSNSAAFGRTADLNFGVGAELKIAGLSAVYTNFSSSVGGALAFCTNNGSSSYAERMRLDSAGNLGLGVTPVNAYTGLAYKNFELPKAAFFSFDVTGSRPIMGLKSNVYYDSGGNTLFNGNGYAVQYLTDSGNHQWYTSTISNSSGAGASCSLTQAMTLDASGNLLVGTTNSSNTAGTGIKFSANGLAASVIADSGTAADTWNVYNTTAGAFRFYVTNGGTIFATSTTISAISDERLKENIQDIDTGLDSIMALKPRRFDWKEGKGQDKKNVAGFIAQEFETVFPECVGLSKAGEDGIEYKNINHETLIPTLVKAMQEQQAIIESLKARLDAANL